MFVNPKPAGWTNDVDTITGLQIGTIATQLVNALDAVGGGNYTITAGKVVSFAPGGGSWSFGCDVAFTSTSAVTVAGSLTWAATKWPAVTSRTVTKQHRLTLASVVQGVGVGSNEPSALVGASKWGLGGYFNTSTIGGLVVANEAIVAVHGTSAAESSYFVIELPDPPDGSVLASVTLTTGAGVGFGGVSVLPKYTLVTWIAGGVLTPIGTVDVADNHNNASWTAATEAGQVLTPTATTTISSATTKYGVLVKNDYSAALADGVLVYGVRAAYTVTSLRP